MTVPEPERGDPRRLAAVVLAAGRSRRMGREKVLLPFGDATCLEAVLALLRGAGVPPASVVVVVRPDLPRAAILAERTGARAVRNPDLDGEMLASIRLGLAELAAGVPGVPGAGASSADAVFIWPADHPAVAAETLKALAAEADPLLAWIPVFSGRRGHPALVGRSLLPDVSRIPPGAGLRELWRARAGAVREMPVTDAGVVTNLDTPAQYEAARGGRVVS